jgi:hypothetical protein
VNRRLFYVVIEGDGPGKVYQYEHKDDDRYEVKVAETQSAETFNHAAERVMFQNKGRSCVGRAVQAMPEFEVLRFQSLGEHRVGPAHAFSEILPLRAKGEHTMGGSQELFLRASFDVLC